MIKVIGRHTGIDSERHSELSRTEAIQQVKKQSKQQCNIDKIKNVIFCIAITNISSLLKLLTDKMTF